MSNSLDKQYQELLNYILRFGVDKKDRTGTGTKSIFGWQIRHNMKEGFPLITTKKMYWKGIVTELLWFLSGDTNIKYLVENDCHIWDGDAYKVHLTNNPEYRRGEYGEESFNFNYLTREEFINKIKNDSEFAKKWGDLGPIYGKQWREWDGYHNVIGENNRFIKNMNGIDQIQNLINDIKANPDSRRLIVNAWNVGEIDQMVLPPCHYVFQVYTRELSLEERYDLIEKDKHTQLVNWESLGSDRIKEVLDEKNVPKRAISLMFNMRSNDVPLGLPFNLASYGLLLEIIGKMVNMIPEELIGNLGDTHIYKNQIDGIKEQLTKVSYPLPKLTISDSVNFTGTIDEFLNSCSISDFKIEGYQSHPTIKIPLSN